MNAFCDENRSRQILISHGCSIGFKCNVKIIFECTRDAFLFPWITICDNAGLENSFGVSDTRESRRLTLNLQARYRMLDGNFFPQQYKRHNKIMSKSVYYFQTPVNGCSDRREFIWLYSTLVILWFAEWLIVPNRTKQRLFI